MKNAKIYIDGTIGAGDFFMDGYSLAKLNSELDSLGEIDTLDVFINSGGGSVTEGWAIYDKLMSLKCVVNTTVNGMCGSIATVIFQAGKKGIRSMYKNSEFFVHNPYWQPYAPDAMEAKDLEALAENLKKEEDRIKNFYAEITGKSIDELDPLLNKQTTLNPQEAKDMGFIDEIIGTDIEAYTKYRICAFLETKNNKMNTELKNELTGIHAILAKIKSKIFKNAYTETTDGKKIYFDGSVIAVDVPVFEDEAMTIPLADGDYTIDVAVYTVVGGVVTAVTDVQAQVDPKIAELENKIAEQEKTINEQTDLLNATKTEFETLASKIKGFEAMIVTGKGFEAKGTQHFQADPTPPSAMQRVIELRKERESK